MLVKKDLEEVDSMPLSWERLDRYSMRRSLRRGSTAQARNKGVDPSIINMNNRWRSQEAAGNRRAAPGSLLESYTDANAAIETLLRYSEPL